jgi:ribosomal protein S13
MNLKHKSETIERLKGISKMTRDLLVELLDLADSSHEGFSITDKKQVQKWTSLTMDLVSSVIAVQYRIEEKLRLETNLPIKSMRQLKTEKIKSSLFGGDKE